MQLNRTARHPGHVIPVTPSTPNRYTHATIRIADACHHQTSSIATRTPLNTDSARTRHLAAYRMTRDPAMPLADIILSFRVSRGCDLRRPVVDSVADGTLAA